MAKRVSLLDEVKEGLATKPGFPCWSEKVTEPLRSELEAVKQAFRAGELAGKKTTLARRLASALQERGIDIGFQGVLRWLEKP